MKVIEEVIFNGRLGRAIGREVGKPGSLRLRLARDTVGVMVIRALSMGLGFAISVVLARLLGVQEFGLYSLAMSVLGLMVGVFGVFVMEYFEGWGKEGKEGG